MVIAPQSAEGSFSTTHAWRQARMMSRYRAVFAFPRMYGLGAFGFRRIAAIRRSRDLRAGGAFISGGLTPANL